MFLGFLFFFFFSLFFTVSVFFNEMTGNEGRETWETSDHQGARISGILIVLGLCFFLSLSPKLATNHAFFFQIDLAINIATFYHTSSSLLQASCLRLHLLLLVMTGWNFFKFGANIHLDARMN